MEELYTKTPPEFIKDLPTYAYSGRIVVIQSESEAQRAVAVLSKSPCVGLDSETRPSFQKGRSNKVALLQIANEELCFLFRLNLMGFPPCLVELLENPKVTKIGLGLQHDFQQFYKMGVQFSPKSVVDLQKMAKDMGLVDQALVKLYANFFHHRICKAQQLSNWENDVLTEAQQKYAATDAVICLHLFHRMRQLQLSDAYVLIPSVVDSPTNEVQQQPSGTLASLKRITCSIPS